jgi:hypothetical protein
MGANNSTEPTEWISMLRKVKGKNKAEIIAAEAENWCRLNPRWKYTGEFTNKRTYFKDNDHYQDYQHNSPIGTKHTFFKVVKVKR